MKVEIGLISMTTGQPKAIRKEIAPELLQEEGEKLINDLMTLGWTPAYVLVDGVQKMIKNGDFYEINLNGVKRGDENK